LRRRSAWFQPIRKCTYCLKWSICTTAGFQNTDRKKDRDPLYSSRLSLYCLPSGHLRFGDQPPAVNESRRLLLSNWPILSHKSMSYYRKRIRRIWHGRRFAPEETHGFAGSGAQTGGFEK
jgi:hypothetical protein